MELFVVQRLPWCVDIPYLNINLFLFSLHAMTVDPINWTVASFPRVLDSALAASD